MKKHPVLRIFAVVLWCFVSSLASLQAQNPVAARTAGPFAYDISEEATMSGTASSLLSKPGAGMIMGQHLMIKTSAGLLDASLGRFGLRGTGVSSIVAGQAVEVAGVMKTMNNKPVFVVRLLKMSGQVYTIRNEHGFPVSPQARERASRKSAGESL